MLDQLGRRSRKGLVYFHDGGKAVPIRNGSDGFEGHGLFGQLSRFKAYSPISVKDCIGEVESSAYASEGDESRRDGHSEG